MSKKRIKEATGGARSDDEIRNAEPEMRAYLEGASSPSADATKPSEPQNLAMPGSGMSAEHEMPSREMNEPAAGGPEEGGEMPHPSMG
jgi:hypothetical protein